MPAALQAKLLRVLEDGLVTPVGGSAEKPVEVRVIAATNANLEAKIAAGTFRADLYFRLARTTLRLPLLRERREDIALLATHFVTQSAEELGLKSIPVISAAALTILLAHDYPGNVRELRNVMENAVITSRECDITVTHLRLGPTISVTGPNPADHELPVTGALGATSAHADPAVEFPLNLDEAERVLIQRALTRAEGNIAEAARLLGVHRSRIYRAMAASSPLRSGR